METGHADRGQSDRGAVVRTWIVAIVAFVITFLAVRWVMRQIWPDQGYLSDLAIDLLRVGMSLAVATAVAIAAGIAAYGRRS